MPLSCFCCCLGRDFRSNRHLAGSWQFTASLPSFDVRTFNTYISFMTLKNVSLVYKICWIKWKVHLLLDSCRFRDKTSWTKTGTLLPQKSKIECKHWNFRLRTWQPKTKVSDQNVFWGVDLLDKTWRQFQTNAKLVENIDLIVTVLKSRWQGNFHSTRTQPKPGCQGSSRSTFCVEKHKSPFAKPVTKTHKNCSKQIFEFLRDRFDQTQIRSLFQTRILQKKCEFVITQLSSTIVIWVDLGPQKHFPPPPQLILCHRCQRSRLCR